MADAKKCDRCGAFYKEEEFRGRSVIKHPDEDMPRYFRFYLESCMHIINRRVDLCPECAIEFNDFLNRWRGDEHK